VGLRETFSGSRAWCPRGPVHRFEAARGSEPGRRRLWPLVGTQRIPSLALSPPYRLRPRPVSTVYFFACHLFVSRLPSHRESGSRWPRSSIGTASLRMLHTSRRFNEWLLATAGHSRERCPRSSALRHDRTAPSTRDGWTHTPRKSTWSARAKQVAVGRATTRAQATDPDIRRLFA